MSVRSVEFETWDWQFGNGLQDYKINQQEIEQNILTTIKSWKNNCFFDLNAGVDWYNIIGSRDKQQYLKQELTRVIIVLDGVVKINNIDININENRNIQVFINLDTVYSNSEFLEVINING